MNKSFLLFLFLFLKEKKRERKSAIHLEEREEMNLIHLITVPLIPLISPLKMMGMGIRMFCSLSFLLLVAFR